MNGGWPCGNVGETETDSFLLIAVVVWSSLRQGRAALRHLKPNYLTTKDGVKSFVNSGTWG